MAQFEGGTIDDKMIPAEVTEAFPLEGTTKQFQARLKSGGTMELKDTTLVIGPEPSFATNGKTFYALDSVVLRNSTIVTNGNTVVIFCNKLVSNEGKIIAFSKRAAEDAKAVGVAGKPGDSGGLVSIHVIQAIEGTISVDLTGQDGGKGAAGTTGAPGGKGAKGQDAAEHPDQTQKRPI